MAGTGLWGPFLYWNRKCSQSVESTPAVRETVSVVTNWRELQREKSSPLGPLLLFDSCGSQRAQVCPAMPRPLRSPRAPASQVYNCELFRLLTTLGHSWSLTDLPRLMDYAFHSVWHLFLSGLRPHKHCALPVISIQVLFPWCCQVTLSSFDGFSFRSPLPVLKLSKDTFSAGPLWKTHQWIAWPELVA